MTNKQALFVLWNAILNQSQDAERTINSTLVLMDRLGLVNDFAVSYDKLDYNLLFTAMTDRPIVHRFYKKMTENLLFSVNHIANCFDGSPCNVFSDLERKSVINNLLEFRGIGLHKAEVAYMVIDIYNKSNNSDVKKLEQNFNSCPALYKTLCSEFVILNYLADKE